jgi:hypothetical protein
MVFACETEDIESCAAENGDMDLGPEVSIQAQIAERQLLLKT